MKENDEIIFRKYEVADLEQLIEIARALPEWFTATGIENMRMDLRFQQGFVAVKDSRIVGFLSFFVAEGVAWIGWMGILSDFHRKGIGRKMVEKLVSELKQAGVHELRVSTLGDSVKYEPYERTRAFYRGIGFTDFQHIKQDNPECPEKLILYKGI